MTGYSKYCFLPIVFVIVSVVFMTACGGGSDGGDTDQNNGGNNNGGNANTELGAIRGSVNSSDGTPLNAVHVRAVNLSDSNIQVSTFSGITRDFMIRNGFFEISNLPPGSYKVLIEKMDSRIRAYDPTRYSDFIISDNPTISFPDEYYNGQEESPDDNPGDFVTVNVGSGQISSGIDFITND